MRTFLLDLYDSVVAFLGSAGLASVFGLIKIISAAISLVLFIIIIYLLIQIRGRIKNTINLVSKSVGAPTLPKKKMARKWDDIMKRITAGDENAYKLAVIDADKVFDDILKRIGYEGKDMGERMKQVKPDQISNINDLWQAHKIRNSIVHDPDFKLTRGQAEHAVKIFGKALKELQVI